MKEAFAPAFVADNASGGIARLASGLGPRILFAPDDGAGAGDPAASGADPAATVAAPAPSPAPAPEPAPAAPAPAAQTSWRDSLPDDIKSAPTLSKFETLEGLAKSYVNLEKMVGTDKVPVPKEGDTEGWARWDKAAGVPEKLEDYGFKPPEGLPEGLQYVPELDQRLATALQKAGVAKGRAGAVRDEVLAIATEVETAKLKQQQAAREAGMADLKKEYGQAFNQEMTRAKLAVKEYAGDEFVAFLEETGYGDDPRMIRAFNKIAKRTMGDKSLLSGEGVAISQTPADLDKAITDHTAKYGAALFDKSHPEHDQRVKERNDLFSMRYPEQPVA